MRLRDENIPSDFVREYLLDDAPHTLLLQSLTVLKS